MSNGPPVPSQDDYRQLDELFEKAKEYIRKKDDLGFIIEFQKIEKIIDRLMLKEEPQDNVVPLQRRKE